MVIRTNRNSCNIKLWCKGYINVLKMKPNWMEKKPTQIEQRQLTDQQTHTHLHIYTYTHTHIYTHTHTYIHTHTYAHTHIYVQHWWQKTWPQTEQFCFFRKPLQTIVILKKLTVNRNIGTKHSIAFLCTDDTRQTELEPWNLLYLVLLQVFENQMNSSDALSWALQV